VKSGFWLVLSEKSDSGFPVVNPAYEANLILIFFSNLGGTPLLIFSFSSFSRALFLKV
jgi:hypothetical protein